MAVPRGNAAGMEFDLVLIITQLLPTDRLAHFLPLVLIITQLQTG